jgi:nucleoside-diphosphate-sugar epimerase
MAATSKVVLVTGGSGFLGSHCTVAALNAGYNVRTTVRSLARSDDVRAMMKIGGVSEDRIRQLQFCEADLTRDDGWVEACKGCNYVLHVASPFPQQPPKHENDLLIPARDGTLRVLRAAKEAGTVRRIVLTASTACMTYGHPPERLKQGPFTEEDWTELGHPQSKVFAYPKSKALAEREAWDWIKKEGNSIDMTTIHPCGIFGPILSKNFGTSVSLVEGFMNGTMPAAPQLGFNAVDVRDVADLHLLAMTDARAKGERFLAVADEYVDVPATAEILRRRLGDKAKKVPTFVPPNWLVKLFGIFDAQAGMLAPELGKRKEESNEKAKRVLGWKPRSAEDAIVATAESLERFGLLK